MVSSARMVSIWLTAWLCPSSVPMARICSMASVLGNTLSIDMRGARSRIGDRDELLGPGSGRPPSAWLEEGGAHERSEHEPSWGFALPVSLPPKLRVTGGETEDMPLHLRIFFRVLSSWVHGLDFRNFSAEVRCFVSEQRHLYGGQA